MESTYSTEVFLKVACSHNFNYTTDNERFLTSTFFLSSNIVSLTNWSFDASNDFANWQTLQIHHNDRSLRTPGAVGTWKIEEDYGYTSWRIFRVRMFEKDSRRRTTNEIKSGLCISGFEIYGS